MKIWNIALTALVEIWAHRFRSLLSVGGIMLGVSSWIAMTALVEGMEQGMKEALLVFGGMERVMIASREELPVHQRHRSDQMRGLTLRDLQALAQGAPLLEQITPSVSMWDREALDVSPVVSRQGKRAWPNGFLGTWPSALDVVGHEIDKGRMFTPLENRLAQNVCVIGTGIRDSLFGSPTEIGRAIDPVGEMLSINGVPFRIVGMFVEYRSEGTNSNIYRGKNSAVYLLLNTLILKLKSGAGTDGVSEPRLSTIDFRVTSIPLLERAITQARNILLRTHHGLEDFSFQSKLEQADELESFIAAARISGGVIAGLALLVGGIGIAYIMLAGLVERVREVGIRKAIGAGDRVIFTQLLFESAGIAALGGLLGIVGAMGLIELITMFSPQDNQPVITAGNLLIAVAMGVLVGLIAGVFPALKAARLSAIDALRYE